MTIALAVLIYMAVGYVFMQGLTNWDAMGGLGVHGWKEHVSALILAPFWPLLIPGVFIILIGRWFE